MCEQAGIKGNKTNHSLRATGATGLYESGVPEKLIQDRTGHRSLEALRVYEWMNIQQHKAVSSIHSAPVQSSYSQQMHTLSVQGYQPSVTNATNLAIGLTLHNLYGCTINISKNCNQISTPTSQTMSEAEIHRLFAAITESKLP